MTKIFQRTVKGRGLHALIVGVSSYSHLPGGDRATTTNAFGMEQLTSTSLSAWKVYQWLLDHKDRLAAPLASVRLLLSPSQRELDNALKDIPNIATIDRATRANFDREAKNWRKAAEKNEDDYTFFYFAGHGVQRSTPNDAVMLMEDYGDPKYDR